MKKDTPAGVEGPQGIKVPPGPCPGSMSVIGLGGGSGITAGAGGVAPPGGKNTMPPEGIQGLALAMSSPAASRYQHTHSQVQLRVRSNHKLIQIRLTGRQYRSYRQGPLSARCPVSTPSYSNKKQVLIQEVLRTTLFTSLLYSGVRLQLRIEIKDPNPLSRCLCALFLLSKSLPSEVVFKRRKSKLL